MDLRGKVAIITGASSGIGVAVAKNLNEADMKLVVTARREERLRRLSESLQECVVIPGDITDPDLSERLLEAAKASFGACDVVVNNAGFIQVAAIEDIDIDRICNMVRVNVEAAYRMAYVALKHFKKVGCGHLINTSSVLGTKVRPTAGAYAGTKFAIEALSEALRMELAGTDIAVSCVEPGLVLTELHKDWAIHPTEMFGISDPLLPEDIARGVRFILEQPKHVRIPKMLMLPGQHSI
jgi:NADP-dependent 3-hydroxy acid dehydrogenase YdfG